MEPTEQYKLAKYALQAGDPEIAERYILKQIGRARSIQEWVDVAEALGLFSVRGREVLGLQPVSIFDMPIPEEHEESWVGIATELLEKAGTGGLRIWTLVTMIGDREGVDKRDPEYRRLKGAELSEQVDMKRFFRDGDRFYLPKYAPVAA